jgi:hypothetical protein
MESSYESKFGKQEKNSIGNNLNDASEFVYTAISQLLLELTNHENIFNNNYKIDTKLKVNQEQNTICNNCNKNVCSLECVVKMCGPCCNSKRTYCRRHRKTKIIHDDDYDKTNLEVENFFLQETKNVPIELIDMIIEYLDDRLFCHDYYKKCIEDEYSHITCEKCNIIVCYECVKEVHPYCFECSNCTGRIFYNNSTIFYCKNCYKIQAGSCSICHRNIDYKYECDRIKCNVCKIVYCKDCQYTLNIDNKCFDCKHNVSDGDNEDTYNNDDNIIDNNIIDSHICEQCNERQFATKCIDKKCGVCCTNEECKRHNI